MLFHLTVILQTDRHKHLSWTMKWLVKMFSILCCYFVHA